MEPKTAWMQLPTGAWVEVDRQSLKEAKRFGMVTDAVNSFEMDVGLRLHDPRLSAGLTNSLARINAPQDSFMRSMLRDMGNTLYPSEPYQPVSPVRLRPDQVNALAQPSRHTVVRDRGFGGGRKFYASEAA